MKTLMITTVAAASALLLAAPALAQSSGPWSLSPSFYGNLGYSNYDDKSDTSAATARLGVRADKYFGVEAEASTGFATGQTHAYGDTAHVRLNDGYAGYAVGYLPVLPNADLFAKVGYGATDSKITGVNYSFGETRSGVAYGAGGQYFFNGPNGVRLDYTRMDYGPTTGDSNVWSLGYVRKF
jgi:outer membrane immunogenic protein